MVRKVYANKAFAYATYAHRKTKPVLHVAFFTDVFLAPKCIISTRQPKRKGCFSNHNVDRFELSKVLFGYPFVQKTS